MCLEVQKNYFGHSIRVNPGPEFTAKYSFLSVLCHRTCLALSITSDITSGPVFCFCYLHSQNKLTFLSDFS